MPTKPWVSAFSSAICSPDRWGEKAKNADVCDLSLSQGSQDLFYFFFKNNGFFSFKKIIMASNEE